MTYRPSVIPWRALCERCRGEGPLYGHVIERMNGAMLVERQFHALCVRCISRLRLFASMKANA